MLQGHTYLVGFNYSKMYSHQGCFIFTITASLSLQMMMSSSVLFVGERRQDSLPTENNRCGDAGDRRAFGSKAGAHRGRTGAGENQ